MQLELKHEERSDNKAIIFTDISPWTDLATAQAAGTGLTLTVTPYQGTTYTIPNSVITDALTAATTVGSGSDVKYVITADHIGLASNALIPDNIYTIEYDHLSHDIYSKNIIVYGVSKQKVWERLASLDDVYLDKNMFSPETEKALVDYAFLLDLESSTYCAQITELEKILSILNNLT